MHPVLEIGSGSYKLHLKDKFNKKFQSSLGKGLMNNALSPDSVSIALSSFDEQISPFLKEHNIEISSLLCFATAAVRVSMQDPDKSGENFINELKSRGIKEVKVFSEEDECKYAAYAVMASLDKLKDYSILDSGGASHQLMEIQNSKLQLFNSFKIGSHTDLTKSPLPNFTKHNYISQKNLVILGTTGQILNHAPLIKTSSNLAEDLYKLLTKLDSIGIAERKIFLEELVENPEIQKLFVDYRLAILPQAIKIIHNVVAQLKVKEIFNSSDEAIHYVSKHGFKN
ncbi:MAG: hypothetical protein HRT47_01275 [Candidatus Caenarcaniphilales bacterium]|nr:hypothetical protein [Candidatus Caenarcaniphilales bacterium]